MLLVELDRGRTLWQALRTVGWTRTAYDSQRYRHPNWAAMVTYTINCTT